MHYYELWKYLVDPKHFGKSQKFTYLWQFDGENLDKHSLIFCFVQGKTMQYGTKMTLYSVHFVLAYSIPWEIPFRPLTIQWKSKFHILMAIWWWKLWQTFMNFRFSREIFTLYGNEMMFYSVYCVHACSLLWEIPFRPLAL